MLYIFLILTLIGLGVQRAAAQTPTPGVHYDFQLIRQGQVGLIEVDGAEVIGATVSAIARTYPCYPDSTGAACLLAVPMDQAIKDYPISIAIRHKDGSTTPWSSTFSVASGQFTT